jgi:hypothetical protein
MIKFSKFSLRMGIIFLIIDLIFLIFVFPYYFDLIYPIPFFLKTIFNFFLFLGVGYLFSFLFFKIGMIYITGCSLEKEKCLMELIISSLSGIFLSLLIYFLIGFSIGYILEKFFDNRYFNKLLEEVKKSEKLNSEIDND